MIATYSSRTEVCTPGTSAEDRGHDAPLPLLPVSDNDDDDDDDDDDESAEDVVHSRVASAQHECVYVGKGADADEMHAVAVVGLVGSASFFFMKSACLFRNM